MSEGVQNPEISAPEKAETPVPAAEANAGTELDGVRASALPASAGPARPPVEKHILYPSPLETVRSLLTILVMALFALTFILQPFRIPSESMERTLLVGDFLLVNKSIYGPKGIWAHLLPYRDVQRGDIVVFHFP